MEPATPTPIVEWLTPDDAAWLQGNSAPSTLVERVCEGFRVAVFRSTSGAAPTAWLAGTLQRGGVGFFDPPAATTQISEIQAQLLLRFMVDHFANSAGMIQLMLPTGAPSTEKAALDSDFQFGADLLLLGRECSEAELEPIEPPLSFGPCEEELPAVLQQTYVETLDCPMLSGKRPISEVIEGYAATGATQKALWRTLYLNDVPLGCVLVSAHPKLDISELVYMGLIPQARGKGLGMRLLIEAERLTLENGLRRMVIGVDGANLPARTIYEASGYAIWEQKRVFLWFPKSIGGDAAP